MGRIPGMKVARVWKCIRVRVREPARVDVLGCLLLFMLNNQPGDALVPRYTRPEHQSRSYEYRPRVRVRCGVSYPVSLCVVRACIA